MLMSLERAQQVLARAERMVGHELSTEAIARFFETHGLVECMVSFDQQCEVPDFATMCNVLYGENWVECAQKAFAVDEKTVLQWSEGSSVIPKSAVYKLYQLFDS